MDKRESLALKQIRSAARDAEARGDAAALAALPGQIDALIANGASEELATALRNLRQVRAHYRTIDDAALLVRVGEIGDEHGYDRATEDEGDEGRGPEYVLEFLNTEHQWDEAYNTQENADFIAKKLGTTAARLTRLDWWPAYVAGLIAGYNRRGQELAEPVLLGWSVDSEGVTVRGRIGPNDMDAWEHVFVLAAEQMTGLDGAQAQRIVESVVRMAGQIEDDPRETGGVRESFPWRLPDGFDNNFEIEELHESLRREFEQSDDVTECEFGRWGEGDQRGQAIFFAETNRCGVVFNGDPIWTDAKSIEEGIGRVVIGQVIE